MTLPAATRPSGVLARSAFSLIELLVVITIIAVVIAITVPALAGARELARKSSTEGTVNSLVQATAQFTTDEQRAPGYFSPEEMGHPDNVTTRGFTSMQNIMLELVGGPVEDDPTNTLPVVGPINDPAGQVIVDPALVNVGDNSKGYYTPGAKDYKPVEGKDGDEDNLELPEVLDAWGMPILAWVENDIGTVMNDSAVIDDFAQIQAGDASEPARFYWAQNSAVLSSAALGQRQIDQAAESLLGVDEMERQRHMTAFLGSPNSSVRSGAAYTAILPRVGRGAVVFQSAGTDRVYLSKDDNGYKRLGGNFYFGRNLTPVASVNAGQYDRPDGTKGSIDIVDGFDDIVTASGN